jgi:hypothetical protein
MKSEPPEPIKPEETETIMDSPPADPIPEKEKRPDRRRKTTPREGYYSDDSFDAGRRKGRKSSYEYDDAAPAGKRTSWLKKLF